MNKLAQLNKDVNSILATIVSPLAPQTFLQEYWPKRHLLIHGDLNRFNVLRGFEVVTQLSDILRIYENAVMVVGEPAIEASEGIADRFFVSPREAEDWYHKGAALEFDYADMYIPGVHRWIEQFQAALGLPKGTLAKVVVYAAPKGGGFQPHFDAYANFVFQIQGRKTWRICPNQNAINPMQHYDLAEAPYIPDELRLYWTGEHPKDGIPEAEVLELQPGSMLFVPRGYWHATESREGTLSMNVTFGQPAWLDLLLAEIRARLVARAPWRELASRSDVGDPEFQAKVRAHLSELLAELPQEVAAIAADDVLQRHTQDLDLYQQTQLAFRQLLRF